MLPTQRSRVVPREPCRASRFGAHAVDVERLGPGRHAPHSHCGESIVCKIGHTSYPLAGSDGVLPAAEASEPSDRTARTHFAFREVLSLPSSPTAARSSFRSANRSKNPTRLETSVGNKTLVDLLTRTLRPSVAAVSDPWVVLAPGPASGSVQAAASVGEAVVSPCASACSFQWAWHGQSSGGTTRRPIGGAPFGGASGAVGSHKAPDRSSQTALPVPPNSSTPSFITANARPHAQRHGSPAPSRSETRSPQTRHCSSVNVHPSHVPPTSSVVRSCCTHRA